VNTLLAVLSRRTLLSAAAIAAVVATAGGSARTAVRRADITALVDRLAAAIPNRIGPDHLPGLAIGICDSTRLLWTKGYGTLRAGEDAPVTDQTSFSIQSCTKMYTATAVMLAVQDGLVDLDEPITAYLQEFAVQSRFETAPERRITLRHLLSHTAGFTHEAPLGNNYEVSDESFEEHCQSISRTWLRFPVGHHYEYSNLGIDLAGYILQRRAGVPFEAFVDDRLLRPLGLDRTTLDRRVAAAGTDRADGHTPRPGGGLQPVLGAQARIPMVAAGGCYTSVVDACRFMQLHLTGGGGCWNQIWWRK
jgi:CubicO group peptidase (beta-lactamase class C family)